MCGRLNGAFAAGTDAARLAVAHCHSGAHYHIGYRRHHWRHLLLSQTFLEWSCEIPQHLKNTHTHSTKHSTKWFCFVVLFCYFLLMSIRKQSLLLLVTVISTLRDWSISLDRCIIGSRTCRSNFTILDSRQAIRVAVFRVLCYWEKNNTIRWSFVWWLKCVEQRKNVSNWRNVEVRDVPWNEFPAHVRIIPQFAWWVHVAVVRVLSSSVLFLTMYKGNHW